MAQENNLSIKKIILNNFKSHKDLELEFTDLNILIGENGAGKSSILEAICYGLFGATASGMKKSDLIRQGCKSGGVTLILSNNYKIVRDFSTNIRLINDENKIISEKASEIEDYLNIDKNVFLNILYGAQNNIYEYFLKFNAKEKDFIDSIFNLDNLTDKISTFLKDSSNELIRRKNDIQSTFNIINNIENNINNMLNQFQLNNVDELIRAVEVSKQNLSNIHDKQNLFNQRNQLLRDLEFKKGSIENLSNQLNQLKNTLDSNNLKIESEKYQFKEYLNQLSKQLNYTIDINNLNQLYQTMNDNVDINKHLNSILTSAQNGLNAQDLSMYNAIIQTVKMIFMLDQYRSYYQKIKDQINQYQRSIDMNENMNSVTNDNISSIKNNIDAYTNSLNDLKTNIDKINEEINSKNLNEEFTDIALKQQAQYSSLNTTLNNVLSQQKTLESIKNKNSNIDIHSIEKIDKITNHIDNIAPIFSRDGFISYLRKSLLKEIGDNIGDSLEQFGFSNLLPVTINEKDGSLVFHDKPFKSLSGGEKTITAILLRILYARLLAPSMRLNLLLLDEPTSNLDSTRTNHIRELLTKLNSKLNTQLIIVTHDSEISTENSNIININKFI